MNTAGDRAAWLSAVTSTVIGALGMLAEVMVIGKGVPGMRDGPAIATIATCTALLIFLLLTRRRVTTRIASVVTVITAAAVAVGLAMRQEQYLAAGLFTFFQGSKLGCLIAAMLAPELWAALIAIAIHFASIVFVLSAMHASATHIVVLEPAASVIITVIAVALAVYRMRRLRLEAEIATLRSERLSTAHLARTMMSVRDLANTPIQTIELNCELLEPAKLVDAPFLYCLRRAAARLREISALLYRYEEALTWQTADASVDAAAELKRSAQEAVQRHAAAT